MVTHEFLIHLGVRKHLSFSRGVSASLEQPRTEFRLFWQLLIWHLPNFNLPVAF